MATTKTTLSKRRLSIKGLDKIFGEDINGLINEIEESDELKRNAVQIDLSQIRPNPYQPRIVFDEAEIAQLAQSIVKHGVLQPVILKKTISGYEVIAGERRVRAAKKAGLNQIQAIILNLSEKQMMEIALIENIQRVDLNTIEEAKAYKELMDKLNLTPGEVAIQVGKSRSHIANKVRILNLPQKIQDSVLKGELTMGQVKPLLAFQDDTQVISQLYEIVLRDNLSARRVEDLVREHQTEIPHETKQIVKKNNYKASEYQWVEDKLIKKLGTKVNINNKKIMIKFANNEDLNRILEFFDIIE